MQDPERHRSTRNHQRLEENPSHSHRRERASPCRARCFENHSASCADFCPRPMSGRSREKMCCPLPCPYTCTIRHIELGRQPDKTRCGDLPDRPAEKEKGPAAFPFRTAKLSRRAGPADGLGMDWSRMRWGRGPENWHWDRIGKQVAAERERRRSSRRRFMERKGATQNVKWWGGQMISGGATASA